MRYRAAAMDGAAGALQRAAIDGARVVERELLEASENLAAVQREAGDHALDIVFMYAERAQGGVLSALSFAPNQVQNAAVQNAMHYAFSLLPGALWLEIGRASCRERV